MLCCAFSFFFCIHAHGSAHRVPHLVRQLLEVADVVRIADDGVTNHGRAHALSRALERLQQEFCVVVSRGFLVCARLVAFANHAASDRGCIPLIRHNT